METKHTPGPWNINGVVEGSGQISISAGRCVVADALNAVSAGDVLFGRRPEMQWANAKLIAAAPDLLESLTNLVGLAKLGAARLDKYHAALATAESAIAKATA